MAELNQVRADLRTHALQQGLPNPDLIVRILLEDLAGVHPGRTTATIPKRILRKMHKAIQYHAIGVPLAHLTGYAYFRSYHLHVSNDTLIPRPETEELIDLVLPTITGKTLCVDIGTGSGAIAIALAKESPAAMTIACDISRRALRVARKNTQKHHAHVTILQRDARTQRLYTDLIRTIKNTRPHHLCVIANLPYIPTDEMPTLEPTVRDFEPHTALDGGPHGTTIIIPMLDHLLMVCARTFVHTDIWLEIDSANMPTLENWAQHHHVKWTFLRDLSGHTRFAWLTLHNQASA